MGVTSNLQIINIRAKPRNTADANAVEGLHIAIKRYEENIQKLESGSGINVVIQNKQKFNEAMYFPTPHNETKPPLCKRYNPGMELTTAITRCQVCTLLLLLLLSFLFSH